MSFTTRALAFAKLWLIPLVFALALLAPDLAGADGRPFSRVVVFGDSLSDPGNLYGILRRSGVEPANVSAPTYGLTELSAFTLIPSLPYEIGGNRFSNGPTWIELLGGALGLEASVKPAFALRPHPKASNYAVAGATAANLFGLHPSPSPFHLSAQVQAFLNDVPRHGLPADTLYVIAIGGNDVRAAFELGAAGAQVFPATFASIANNITNLYYYAGARRFLIWNIPNLGGTPAFARLEAGLPGVLDPIPGLRASVAGLIGHPERGLNQQLATVLTAVSGALPGIEIARFDAFGSLNAVQADPNRFGLIDAAHACIEPNVPPDFVCDQPDRHFFWDGIHPTRAGHAIIAFLVGKALVSAVLQDD